MKFEQHRRIVVIQAKVSKHIPITAIYFLIIPIVFPYKKLQTILIARSEILIKSYCHSSTDRINICNFARWRFLRVNYLTWSQQRHVENWTIRPRAKSMQGCVKRGRGWNGGLGVELPWRDEKSRSAPPRVTHAIGLVKPNYNIPYINSMKYSRTFFTPKICSNQ